MLSRMTELLSGYVSHGALLEGLKPYPKGRPMPRVFPMRNMEVTIGDLVSEGEQPGNTWRVGARVSWTSSNAAKSGEITHVIPAGKLPSDFGVKIKDATSPRDHETYIVRGQPYDPDMIPPEGVRKSNYWPRVSLLKVVG